MVEQGSPNGFEREGAEDGESEGLDLERIRETVGFVLHASARRPKLTALTFLTVAALGIAVATVMPRTYSATVKILAQRVSAIRTLTSPNPGLDDNPTKNVAAMITRRDNLLALVKEANLVQRHRETRSAFLKLKDRVFAKFMGTASDEDMQVALAQTLESRLDVTTPDDTSLSISVEWSNPQLAYDLVTLVEKNFLEARYDGDVAVVTESIAVLEEHAKNELTHVDAELENYQKVIAERGVKQPSMAPTAPHSRLRPLAFSARPSASSAGPEQDPNVAKQLEDARARLRLLEEEQQRAIDEARQRLTQAQLTLTPMHPTVIALQQQLDTVSQPSAALTELRDQERALMAQIAPPRPAPSAAVALRPSLPTLVPDPSASAADSAQPDGLLPPPVFDDRDGVLQLAQSRLGSAIRSYEDAMGSVDRAKVELDVTRAAYKYRYTVVTPAEVPRHPKKATANIVAVGSVLGGALLALLLAAAADMAGGIVLEPWQVRRRLKIDVLGELDIPS